MGDIIGITNILMAILGVVVKFIYNSLTKADSDLKEELSKRIDKLEENSRKDDNAVKELIKDAESRMHGEINARIRNIVELHAKIEKNSETLTSKHENVLERVSKLEGRQGN
jgi:hypothetical protein